MTDDAVDVGRRDPAREIARRCRCRHIGQHEIHRLDAVVVRHRRAELRSQHRSCHPQRDSMPEIPGPTPSPGAARPAASPILRRTARRHRSSNRVPVGLERAVRPLQVAEAALVDHEVARLGSSTAGGGPVRRPSITGRSGARSASSRFRLRSDAGGTHQQRRHRRADQCRSKHESVSCHEDRLPPTCRTAVTALTTCVDSRSTDTRRQSPNAVTPRREPSTVRPPSRLRADSGATVHPNLHANVGAWNGWVRTWRECCRRGVRG